MGKFLYGERVKVDFEDRLLSHLQLVIGAKIRRGESFHFSWKDDPSIGDGRTVIWIHPQALITYKFYGSRAPAINRTWLDQLSTSANSPSGLHVTPEPVDVAGHEGPQ